MCGIAGIIDYKDPKNVLRSLDGTSHQLTHQMLTDIQHRGPDEAGIVTKAASSLGNVRLSIIDLSNGTQPISNADETIWIVYNGEIYDFDKIRSDLASRGCKFKTRTDTEVILYLYQEFGLEFYSHLNGEFAFVIMDLRGGGTRFVLSRDLWGTRPLFYTLTDKGMAFCSEVRPLLGILKERPSLDSRSFLQTVSSWAVCPPATAFEGIKTLSPGEMIVIEGSNLSRKSWLNSFFENATATKRVKDTDTIKNILVRSVNRRLVADVPVGVYLSGGLDSSIVSLLASRNYPGKIDSYSIAFEDPTFDESSFQQELSQHLGTNHHQLKISSKDLVDNFIPATLAAENFVFRSAFVPMYLLSGLVRKNGGKVVLTGEGADEFFSGYDIYRELKILHGLGEEKPDFVQLTIWLSDLYKYIPEYSALDKRILLGYYSRIRSGNSEVPLSHRQRWTTFNKLKGYFNSEWDLESLAVEYKELFPVLGKSSEGNKARLLECLTLLHGYLLSTQGDKMALANSVETRLPFLDRELVEYLLSLDPMDLMLASAEGIKEKNILYEGYLNELPAIFKQKRKTPYLAPDMQVYGEFFKSLILDNKARLQQEIGVLNLDTIEALFNKPVSKISRAENSLLFSTASATVLLTEIKPERRSLIPLAREYVL